MLDPVSIGLLLASAAVSAHANDQAAKRQQRAAREAQQRQLQAQNRATDTAMKRVQEFDAGNRNEQQAEIAQELTGKFDAQVAQPQITAQGVQVGTTLPAGEGSTDYLKAQAREASKSTASLRALAALMGRTGAATELRRKEAVGIGDTAGEIGRIGTGAANIWGADQAGIQAAGRPSIGAGIASAALGAAGTAGLVNGGLSGLIPGAAPVAGTGFNVAAPSGMGLRVGGGLGLR